MNVESAKIRAKEMREIYTIGHSVIAIDIFQDALLQYGIEMVADVRSIPASRWHPQFGRIKLEASLKQAGIGYTHMPQLGGRQAVPFKDYVGTRDFIHAIQELEALAIEKRMAFMCAEADPRNCHRLYISQWLHNTGWCVVHILKGAESAVHPATKAEDRQGGLFY